MPSYLCNDQLILSMLWPRFRTSASVVGDFLAAFLRCQECKRFLNRPGNLCNQDSYDTLLAALNAFHQTILIHGDKGGKNPI